MEYVNLTPTWTGILPALLAVYVDGDASGSRLAADEMLRAARLADRLGEFLAHLDEGMTPAGAVELLREALARDSRKRAIEPTQVGTWLAEGDR